MEFLKNLANILGIGVTILGLLAVFFKVLDPLTSTIILAIILFLGFISMIVYQVNKIENKQIKLEEKLTRAEDLITLRAEIELLKRKIK